MNSVWLVFSALVFAFAVGANTLLAPMVSLTSSGLLDKKRAVRFALIGFGLGGFCAYFVTDVIRDYWFSAGLVFGEALGDPAFIGAVVTGAGATLGLATLMGWVQAPFQLVGGATVGAGFVGWMGYTHADKYFDLVFVPALVGCVAAFAAAKAIEGLLGLLRRAARIQKRVVLLHQGAEVFELGRADNPSSLLVAMQALEPERDNGPTITTTFSGDIAGIEAQSMMDGGHLGLAILVTAAAATINLSLATVFLESATGWSVAANLALVTVFAVTAGIFYGFRVHDSIVRGARPHNAEDGLISGLAALAATFIARFFGIPVDPLQASTSALGGTEGGPRVSRNDFLFSTVASWVVMPLVAAAAAGLLMAAFNLR